MGVDNSGFLMIGYDTDKEEIDFSVLGFSAEQDGDLADWLWWKAKEILPESLHLFEFGTPSSMSDQNQEFVGLYIMSGSHRTELLPANIGDRITEASSWMKEKFGTEPLVLLGNAQY